MLALPTKLPNTWRFTLTSKDENRSFMTQKGHTTLKVDAGTCPDRTYGTGNLSEPLLLFPKRTVLLGFGILIEKWK
jgi:hypothetical protein